MANFIFFGGAGYKSEDVQQKFKKNTKIKIPLFLLTVLCQKHNYQIWSKKLVFEDVKKTTENASVNHTAILHQAQEQQTRVLSGPEAKVADRERPDNAR